MSKKKKQQRKVKKLSPEGRSISPLRVHLRSGEELAVARLGMSGYVAAPVGAMILGGTASRATVGKFCVGVEYLDGQTGIIAQEEIAKIVDSQGRVVPYGNPKYPGHPQFDPRDGFDPLQEQMNTMKRIMKEKEERHKKVKEVGLATVMEEEMARYRKLWGTRDEEFDGQGQDLVEENKTSDKKKREKKDKKKKALRKGQANKKTKGTKKPKKKP